MRWLTSGKSFGKPISPFAQTTEIAVFYTDVDPRDLLPMNEIETWHQTPKRLRDKQGVLFPIIVE